DREAALPNNFRRGLQQRHGTGSLKAPRGAGIPSPLDWNPSGSAGSTGCRRTKMSRRLFGRSLRHRLHRHEDPAFGFGTELDAAGGQCEQRVVLAQADILARMPFGAALAGDDVAGQYRFAAENLQPQALTVGVAAVAR